MAHEAAKVQGVGYAGKEDWPVVDIDEVGRDSLKTVNLPATETADVGDKGGATCDDHEESQVAKKPRTENVNGVGAGKEGLEKSGQVVSGDGDVAEKPAADPVGKPSVVGGPEAHKAELASEEVTDEVEDQDKKSNAEDVHAEMSKADGQGEVGLRSLLQEGETNLSVLNSDVGDATHIVKGAKAL